MTTKISSDDRIVLWQGASLWVFDILPPTGKIRNRMHAHHAFQLTLAAGGIANIRTQEGLHEGPVILIAPDHPHSIEPVGRVALVFAEPESPTGRRLGRLLAGRPIARLAPMPASVRRLDPMWDLPQAGDAQAREIGEAILRDLVGAGEAGHPVDPRVQRVLAWLDTADGAEPSLQRAAAIACLSESRFSHLFVQETGLAFRTYVLWRRLMVAVERRSAGASLTEAAHDAGFADSAHFSRTFLRMFGVPADTMWLGSRRPPPVTPGAVLIPADAPRPAGPAGEVGQR